MSKTEKDNTQQYNSDDGFVFKGNPEDISVEEAVEEEANKTGFDAFKLASVLLIIGQKMTGITLYDYQKEPTFRIIYSMLVNDGAEITILYPRQSGKSEVVSIVSVVIGVLFPVLARLYPKELYHFSKGVKMGLLAPQYDQVDTVYARCVERLLSEPVQQFMSDPDIGDAPLSKARFRTKAGSTLTPQSAAKQSKVESKTYHIIFLDESQDLDTDKVRRSIIPMTASTFGTIIRTGTPGRYKGDFYYTITNNKKHDAKLRTKRDRQTKQLHFEYTYKDVIKHKNEQYKIDGINFHKMYEKSVLRDRDSMGENSEAFRMAYNSEWLLDVGMFITEKDMDIKLLNRRRGFPDYNLPHMVNQHNIAGLDIASARAQTILTFGHIDSPAFSVGEHPHKTVGGWVAIDNMNYEEQFQTIARELLDRRIKVLYADYTGVGRALTDTLMYHLGNYLEIVPYVFSAGSKSDMWKALDEDINNSKMEVPASKAVIETAEYMEFYKQMTNLQKYWRGSYLVCEKTQGFKDDYCDSLGLFNLAGNHIYAPEQEMEVYDENMFFGLSARDMQIKNNSSW